MDEIIEKKRQDRRCRKTVESIKTALLTMLADRPLSEISISELAETADINRKTFYNHYTSLQDVLVDIEDELSDSIFDVLKHEDFLENMGDPKPFFDALSARLKEQESIYRILIRSGIEAEIFTKIRAWARDYIYHMLSKNFLIDYDIFQFYLNVILAQISAAYKEWFCSDKPSISLDQLSGFICSQVFAACRFLAEISALADPAVI
ncbi:TetR/AcrR family transcriptional regulator [Clostridium sp. AM58-1XD]|uniref:TetR/AcrR family transcriptional regulator n=1 Tax=Clostridium sp. AM58-1XD TaxID=2292307 RepID=UPI000E52DC14|nr:TetR/AcrR family transcriptional regulator [Clostridium sp. AM58-1XD]RGY96364.1 TetR/AcrR family transcriptional regulator [Clostridium sp. AM58-1XD]